MPWIVVAAVTVLLLGAGLYAFQALQPSGELTNDNLESKVQRAYINVGEPRALGEPRAFYYAKEKQYTLEESIAKDKDEQHIEIVRYIPGDDTSTAATSTVMRLTESIGDIRSGSHGTDTIFATGLYHIIILSGTSTAGVSTDLRKKDPPQRVAQHLLLLLGEERRAVYSTRSTNGLPTLYEYVFSRSQGRVLTNKNEVSSFTTLAYVPIFYFSDTQELLFADSNSASVLGLHIYDYKDETVKELSVFDPDGYPVTECISKMCSHYSLVTILEDGTALLNRSESRDRESMLFAVDFPP